MTPLFKHATKIVPRGFSLGSHSPTNKPGFSPWGMLFVCAIIIFLITASARAQTAPCGLTSITYEGGLVYPPIAKLAHIDGKVILMVRFKLNGRVENLTELSNSHLMLHNAATAFVKSAQANEFSGPRECPIIINFIIGKRTEKPQTTVIQVNLQHVQITSEMYPSSSDDGVIRAN